MKYMVTLNGKKVRDRSGRGPGNRQQRYNRPHGRRSGCRCPRGSSRPCGRSRCSCPLPLPLHPLRLPLRQMAQTLCAQCPARF